MAGPRSFVEKKDVPGMSATRINDRNVQLEIQNVIENIRALQKRIASLESADTATGTTIATGGADGSGGDNSVNGIELYDSTNIPPDPPLPYLRFERDVDGDVQFIYIGTDD